MKVPLNILQFHSNFKSNFTLTVMQASLFFSEIHFCLMFRWIYLTFFFYWASDSLKMKCSESLYTIITIVQNWELWVAIWFFFHVVNCKNSVKLISYVYYYSNIIYLPKFSNYTYLVHMYAKCYLNWFIFFFFQIFVIKTIPSFFWRIYNDLILKI